MWKAPNRPKNQITQSFNDGVITVYGVVDGGEVGYRPKPIYQKKYTLRYERQRLGVTRLYLAKQNQIEITEVLRVPFAGKVTNQDIAVLEDGSQYQIESVQTVQDVYPHCVDIALSVIKQNIEVVSDEVV